MCSWVTNNITPLPPQPTTTMAIDRSTDGLNGWAGYHDVRYAFTLLYKTLHYFTATPPALVVVQLRDLQLHTSRHITTSTIQCTLTVYIPIQHLNCYLFPSYRNAPAHVQENAWMVDLSTILGLCSIICPLSYFQCPSHRQLQVVSGVTTEQVEALSNSVMSEWNGECTKTQCVC